MTKLKLITILLTFLLSVNSSSAFNVKARTAILQDYLSGEILFEKDADKSIIGTVGINADYPLFNNAVLSVRIAEEIDLNENEPYVEIFEILEDSVFVAKRAKMFEEEKKVADKAPVNNINISNLNVKETSTKNELSKKFSYEIKIADFYFNDTASLLVDRIIKETRIKDAKIKKINEKKYRVYAGPFNNINSLQKSFNDISILEFENIEIIKND